MFKEKPITKKQITIDISMPDIKAAANDIDTEHSERHIKLNIMKENILYQSEIFKDETMITSIHKQI